MIEDKALAEFKQIVREENNIELTDEQAIEEITAFLQAMKIFISKSKKTSLILKDSIDLKEK